LNPTCTKCGSDNTVWKTKAQQWECEACEGRFDATAPGQDHIPDPLADAESDFLRRARDLAESPAWLDNIPAKWPTPIAHTYQLLRNSLRRGQVDAAAMVLKDLTELIARFSALVMACDILAHGASEKHAEVRRDLFGKLATMGDWVRMADKYAQWICADITRTQSPTCPELASMWRTPGRGRPTAWSSLMDGAKGLIKWRNETLGHGVRGADLSPLMSDLERYLGEGQGSLHHALAAHTDIWSVLALRDARGTDLMGLRDAVSEPHAMHHALGPIETLRIDRTDGSSTLDLGSFLSVRRCQVCGDAEIFHYDSARQRKSTPDFRLLNYERGHALSVPAGNDEQLQSNYFQINRPNIVQANSGFEQPALSIEVARMLDEQNVEKGYLSPEYLRAPLTAYIERALSRHQGGLYWLRAPAHVGKSTFVRGIDPDYRQVLHDAPLLDNLAVVVFYIRREYQFHLAQFAEQLRDGLRKELGLVTLARKLPELDTEHPCAAALCTFLGEFQQLSNRPILVVIDGLDELAEPVKSSPSIADYLPQPEELPANVFVLLTSRRLDELAPWLARRISPLLGAPGREVGLKDDDYRALLRSYAIDALQLQRSPPKHRSALDLDLCMPILWAKSDGRFLYFRFLIDRLADDELLNQDVQSLGSPETLIPQYLEALRARYAGTPHADLIDRTLHSLAAAEGAALNHQQNMPVLAQSPWIGVPMPVLCQMVEGQPVMTPRLASVLYLLKPLLGTWRGDDTGPRYHLGIKGMEGLLQRDEQQVLWIQVRRLVENLLEQVMLGTDPACRNEDLNWVVDHMDGYAAALDPKDKEALRQSHGDALIMLVRELSGRAVEAARASRNADALSHITAANGVLHWIANQGVPLLDVTQPYLAHGMALLLCQGQVLADLGDSSEAIKIFDRIISSLEELKLGESFPPDMAAILAYSYAGRGLAHSKWQAYNQAGEDNEQAIALWGDLSIRLGDKFPPDWSDGLATSYLNGVQICVALKDDTGAQKASDRAITIWMDLRARPGSQFLPDMVDHLARAYGNRGSLLVRQHDDLGALEAYEQAIALWEDLSAQQEAQFSPVMADSLAATYSNVGNVFFARLDRNIGSMEAMDAYRKAILIRTDLHTRLDAQFPPDMANALAIDWTNCAAVLSSNGDFASALQAHDRAIALREELRLKLDAKFPPGMADSLATNFMERGKILRDQHDRDDALKAFQQAIEIWEGLHIQLGIMYPSVMANSLATAYLLRAGGLTEGVSFGDLHEQKDAVMAIERAEVVRKEAHARSGVEGMPDDWLHGQAIEFIYSGSRLEERGDLAQSKDAYNHAINILEALRTRQGTSFSSDMTNQLAISYVNRSDVLSKLDDKLGEIESLTRALSLWDELDQKMGTEFPSDWAEHRQAVREMLATFES
jgi:tetratricopeptide (TPR) repeat protein